MNLFDYEKEKKLEKRSPLASRMRPQNLDDFIGQEHIVAKDKMLYRAIKADRLSSIILYGPPGSGKTTIAKIIANTSKASFQELNATRAGVKDIKAMVDLANDNLVLSEKKTILFIDEIHRFNKAQQDSLLPHVENGIITLIGASTENPFFEVNSALVSRSLVLELKPLTKDDIKKIILNALSNKENGLANFNVEIDDKALDFISDISGGDARAALNAVELATLTTDAVDDKITIDLKTAEDCIQKRAILYDKNADMHYDTISAFIKSMRGSDPDAAIYYLARMLKAGEDPKFIARRIVICASEDVGNADPNALNLAVSAFLACERIGMPESQIILSQIVSYIALAPKSNAALGIFSAVEDVNNIHIEGIPNHLKDAHYKQAAKLSHGKNYLYPHDYPKNYVKQQYLPDELKDKKYYFPSNNGREKNMKEFLEKIDKLE